VGRSRGKRGWARKIRGRTADWRENERLRRDCEGRQSEWVRREWDLGVVKVGIRRPVKKGPGRGC
jgi:hypothetical protein